MTIPGASNLFATDDVTSPNEDGFVALFDGTTLEGWVDGRGQPIEAGWVIEEGTLCRRQGGGSIHTAKTYEHFDLRLEWKISPGGNSGIKYRFTKYDKGRNGPEYQILDDAKHPDSQRGAGKRKAACLYDILAADTTDAVKPAGEWNTARIVARGSKVEHYLNGKKVLAYDTESEAYLQAVAKSKFRGWEKYGSRHRGQIQLQDHGNLVWYRNMRIKELETPTPNNDAG